MKIQNAILLKFRDMVTEPGGTIAEHRERITETGHAWWGWWSHQKERVPREILQDRDRRSQDLSEGTTAILFDSGTGALYAARTRGIVVAPVASTGVQPPSYENTPSYYHRGRYQAWFKFDAIEGPLGAGRLFIRSFPTMDELESSHSQVGEASLDRLRGGRVTLWTADFELES